ncbi:unnamed protein product, partial [Prorocentrum cordatum]
PVLVVLLVAVLAFLLGFAAASALAWWRLRRSEAREVQGQRVLVSYDADPRELLWHERLLRAHVHGSLWGVATPERDMYLEDLQEGIESLVPLGPLGGLPAGWSRGPFYRFRGSLQGPLFQADILRLPADGAELADQERLALGLEDMPPLPPPEEAPPAPVLESAARPEEGERRFLETRGEARLGERVVPAALEAGCCRGDRGVAKVGGAFVSCAFFRTLPVKYETSDRRHRSHREAASLTATTAFDDWHISGPRAAEWLAREIARQELTLVSGHFWRRQLLNLGPSDWGAGEHEALSRLFEYALTYDQLNLGELASLELAGRRHQLLEKRCARMLVAATASGDSGHLDNDRLFMGEEGRHGRALVAPALEPWISHKVSEESAAMEERQLTRSTDATPDAGSGQNDDEPPKNPRKKGGGQGGGAA